jgi:hypothetical protein
MGDTGDDFNAMNNAAKIKRKCNTKSSTDVLMSKQVSFVNHNNGAHLVICHFDLMVDFWPATGLWKVRKSPKEGRGVFKLLKYLGVN